MCKIEIIIPSYNCSSTLDRTLASLEAQTDNDFSVHIVDDCSTEDLTSILCRHDKLNLKVTRNDINLGCGMSRQVGIDTTNADYIAFLDSDDVLMPYTVETWRNAAEKSPETDVFHSTFYEQTVNSDRKPVLKLIPDGFTWCHGKLYKVSFIKKYDIRNNPEIRYMDDSFFNSMCSELGEMSIIQIPMYMWLNNNSSITRNGKMNQDECHYDFIHGLILSTKFVYSKGKTHIEHIPLTLEALESLKSGFSDKTLNEYNTLISLIKGGV